MEQEPGLRCQSRLRSQQDQHNHQNQFHLVNEWSKQMSKVVSKKCVDLPATICENLDNTFVASMTTSAGAAIFTCLLIALEATV